MNRALLVARMEYVINVKRKGFILTTLILPLFMVGAMVIPLLVVALSSHEGEAIGIVDETHGLYETIRENYANVHATGLGAGGQGGGYSLVEMETEEDARRALERGMLSGYLVVPSSFVEENRAKYVSKATNILVVEELGAALHDARIEALLSQADVPEETLEKITRAVSIDTFKATKEGESRESELSFFRIFLFSYFLGISIFMSGGYLLQSVVEEKEGRIVEVLLSSLSAMELMVGKIAGLGALGLTQMAVWGGGLLALGLFVESATPITTELLPPSLMAPVFVYFLLGYLFFACLFAAVGALSTNLRESQQVSGFISIPAFMPMMFFIYVMDNPNSILVNVLSHIPFFTPTLMIMRMVTTEVPGFDIVTTTVCLALSTYVAARLAAKVFRIGILLTGKRPTIREVLSFLRYE